MGENGRVGSMTGPFRSASDIELYVGGDRITCLLCGKAMKSLNSHIQRVHGRSSDDYRAEFNIPKKYPLCCAETARKHSEVASRPGNMARIAALGKEFGPITNGHAVAHPLLLSRPKTWDFSWHLEQSATNPLYLTVIPPEGLASWHTFWQARCADPELQRQWEDARAKWDHQANYQPRAEHGRFCSVDAGRAQSA